MDGLSDWLWEPQSASLGILALFLLKSTLLLAGAWLLHSTTARFNPRWRVLLWRSTAVALLILGGTSVCPPFLKLPLLPAPPPQQSAIATNLQPSAVPATDVRLDFESTPLAVTQMAVESQSPDPILNSEITKKAAGEPVIRHSIRNGIHLPGLATRLASSLFAVWVVGLLLGAIYCLAGWQRLCALRQKSTAVDSEIIAEATKAAAALQVTHRFEVRRSSQVQSPCLIGIARPLILVSEYHDETAQREEMPSILAHELAHLKGSDHCWNALLQALSILFWFHPLMWKVRTAHVDACDSVCDAMASHYVGSSTHYARTLARITLRLSHRTTAVGLAMARHSAISHRIAALQRHVFIEPLGRRRVFSCEGLVLISALAAGGLTLTSAPAATQSASPLSRLPGQAKAQFEVRQGDDSRPETSWKSTSPNRTTGDQQQVNSKIDRASPRHTKPIVNAESVMGDERIRTMYGLFISSFTQGGNTVKTASVSQLLSATVVAMAISVVNASDDAPAPKAGSMPTVLNGSFEQSKDSDTRPDSWFAARPPKSGALCTMARRTDFAKDGSASAYIEISANHSGDRVSYNWVTQLTDLSPGKDYVLEGWIKTENAGSTPVIVVQCWGKKNEWLGFATTEKEFVLTGSNDWKPVKTKFNVPEGTEKVLVRAALSTDKNQGAKAWFDGIAVAESK